MVEDVKSLRRVSAYCGTLGSDCFDWPGRFHGDVSSNVPSTLKLFFLCLLISKITTVCSRAECMFPLSCTEFLECVDVKSEIPDKLSIFKPISNLYFACDRVY